MTLSLLRMVPQVSENCRNGGTKAGFVGNELMGKTVGVVGVGAIGQRVIELFKVFNCKIVAYNPSPRQIEGVAMLTLEEVCKQADILTIHCPMNESTIGLIDERLIRSMKSTAILINCARGPIVDELALTEALYERRLAGAGIDVFQMEPPLPEDLPLLHTPNTLVTPHIAFATKESMIKRGEIVFANMESWLQGKQINVID